MKRLFLLSVMLLLINGCSESNDTIDEQVVVDPVIETFTITADHTNINSLQIVTLTIPSTIILTNQIYTAKFDATEITLSRKELNKLSFITPDLPSKNYNFLIEINGKQSSLNFTLQAIENSEDVTAFIESEMLTPLKELNKIANSEMSDPNLSVEERDIIEFGNEFYNKLLAGYASLSGEDRQLLRKFLIANEISFKSIEGKNGSKSSYDINNWEVNLDNETQHVIENTIDLVAHIVLVGALITVPEPLFSKIASLAVTIDGIYAFKQVIKSRERLIDLCFHPFQSFISQLFDKSISLKTSTETYAFQNNVLKNIRIESKGRKLQKSDIGNSNSKIAFATSSVIGADKVWNEFKENVDRFISIFGSFFNITTNKINSTSGLPENSPSETIILDNKFFKIDNISSTITSQLTIKDENTLQLKFSTLGDLPSSFDAKFKYDDGIFKTESDFIVNLLSNISVTDSLDFGEKLISSSTKKSFIITNVSTIPITITSIVLPNGFVSNWLGGSIPTSGSKQVEITFNPKETKDYSGNIIVKNNIDDSSATTSLNAIGVGGLSLIGDLEFGEVKLNTSVVKKLTLKNESAKPINVSSINLPTGFTADWKNGTVGVSGSVTVDITFKPTEVKEYSGIITVSNDTDQKNNTIVVSGNGVESNLFIGTWKAIKVNNRAFVYGETYTEYIDGCSNLIDFIETIYSFYFTFGSNDFNYSINEDYTTYNYSDFKIEDCSYSSLNISKNTPPAGESGSYIILNGNTLTVTYTDDGFVENWDIQFLDDDTLSISIDGETAVFKRQ
ncbi:MAG: choice-of-anchor D domain-containing protein [Lutibacter sp.]